MKVTIGQLRKIINEEARRAASLQEIWPFSKKEAPKEAPKAAEPEKKQSLYDAMGGENFRLELVKGAGHFFPQKAYDDFWLANKVIDDFLTSFKRMDAVGAKQNVETKSNIRRYVFDAYDRVSKMDNPILQLAWKHGAHGLGPENKDVVYNSIWKALLNGKPYERLDDICRELVSKGE